MMLKNYNIISLLDLISKGRMSHTYSSLILLIHYFDKINIMWTKVLSIYK